MQERMRTHRLPDGEAAELLQKAHVGHLGTFGQDGYPYVIPLIKELVEKVSSYRVFSAQAD
jgi:nitroimidazol reductase NimA-like FMN-containing flavoprotein (pyridoxamine 5'-phosphate oxidase superfamily)